MPKSPNPVVPQQVAPLLALATRALRDGRPDDAISPLREAALLQPSNPIIQHDLGLAYLEVGRVSDAIATLQRAVASNPRYSDAFFRLGIALEKMGNISGAIVAYDRATELLPSLTEAWFRAGALVYTLGHRDEAIGCFRRAAATGGKSSFGRLGKARALLTEDRNQEAEQVLRQTLAVDPRNALAHDLLGNLLSEFGRFDEARECFQRAVEIAPLLAGCYYDLVRCRPVTSDDDGLLQRMDAALATPGLEVAQRLRLHLAIGKAAEDLGDYALAMQHFDAADGVRRSSVSFDSAAFAIEIDRLIARCTPEWIARASELGSSDTTPVLIIGMPRSGTTLVEQIVSNHPEVGAGDELQFWNQRGAAWHRSCVAETEMPVVPTENLVSEFVASEFLAKAAADYLSVLRAIAPRAARVTDKMPFNFLWAGLIHVAFPRAIIIHCRRTAVDTALSIHQTHFHPGLAFPTGGAELVAYFRSYQRLIDHWRNVLPANRFIEVDYEELTRAPEPIIRRIIAACGLAWHDACLRPESNPRAVKTPSKWQTRQPIYRTSVERWRRYEPWLGPLRALVDVK
ncbi:MAG TPA: sulfotransferase [Candidatus Deferrimicrobiaceae bacterium]|jgi:tetratricopeptide (TPR) repeat protein|nr:sulfotransferase [Candidatus Deferrimicrobiaceae bacterium]